MKNKKVLQKLRKPLKKIYITRKEFETLEAELQKLRKIVIKLKKKPQKASAAMAKNASNNIPPETEPVAGEPLLQDDLKQIKGIGPALEKKLNFLGIVSLEQIAVWSAADVEQISPQLNCSQGRIEREEWVRQAMKLA